jgi:hypothetical protein
MIIWQAIHQKMTLISKEKRFKVSKAYKELGHKTGQLPNA